MNYVVMSGKGKAWDRAAWTAEDAGKIAASMRACGLSPRIVRVAPPKPMDPAQRWTMPASEFAQIKASR